MSCTNQTPCQTHIPSWTQQVHMYPFFGRSELRKYLWTESQRYACISVCARIDNNFTLNWHLLNLQIRADQQACRAEQQVISLSTPGLVQISPYLSPSDKWSSWDFQHISSIKWSVLCFPLKCPREGHTFCCFHINSHLLLCSSWQWGSKGSLLKR